MPLRNLPSNPAKKSDFTEEAQKTIVPVKPSAVNVRLTVSQPGGVKAYAGKFEFTITDSAGNVVSQRSGDLLPFLTAAQVTTLKGLLDAVWTKAQSTVP